MIFCKSVAYGKTKQEFAIPSEPILGFLSKYLQSRNSGKIGQFSSTFFRLENLLKENGLCTSKPKLLLPNGQKD